MNDLRTQLPECRLEYQVPHIPASHTALVIEINAADIEWQERMLPWTLAGLINNTDIVMKGVHLYIACEDGTQERIRTALKKIDLPPGTLITKDAERTQPLILFGHYGHRYDSVCILDVNYWAFRGIGKRQEADIKLPFGHVLRYTWNWAVANYSLRVENDIYLKDTWVGLSKPGCLTGGDSPRHQKRLAGARIAETSSETSETSVREGFRSEGNGFVHRRGNARNPDFSEERAHWLHTANTAVYGEGYKKQNTNVAAYFFNETESNWHLDASILKYSASEVNNYFTEWAREWQHLGTEALIALWLLKTQQHAHSLADSIKVEPSYVRAEYPRLCNMESASIEQFSYAMKELQGAQLNMKM